MGRHCTVCTHIDREEIDALMVGGSVSNRAIAGRYSLSRAAVDRHREHLAKELVTAAKQAEALRASDVLARIVRLADAADRIVTRAEQADDQRLQLLAIREARPVAELLARIARMLGPESVTNVLVQNGARPISDELTDGERAELARIAAEHVRPALVESVAATEPADASDTAKGAP